MKKNGWLLLLLLVSCAPKLSSLAQGKYCQTPHMNQDQQALEIFQQYLKQSPEAADAPEAQYLIGKSYHKLHKTAEAKQAFLLVLDNYPESPYAALALRQLARQARNQGTFKEAISLYQQAMERDPSETNMDTCTIAMAQIYSQFLNEPQLALKEYKKLLRDLKNQGLAVRAYLATGRIYVKLREYQKAAEAFQQLIDKYGWSPNAKIAQQELDNIAPYLKKTDTIDES